MADITYVPTKERCVYLRLVTDGYDCQQNPLAERINGILKTEFLFYRPTDLVQARQIVVRNVGCDRTIFTIRNRLARH